MAKLKRTWNKKYELIEKLGEGGNAQVYRVREFSSGNNYALKELKDFASEKKQRFLDEIQIMKKAGTVIEGIIPIYKFSIDEYWYTMPIAMSAVDYIAENKLGIEEIIKGMVFLCETG